MVAVSSFRVISPYSNPADPLNDFATRLDRGYSKLVTPRKRALDPQTAFLTISLMRNVIEHGTVPMVALFDELRSQAANDGVTDIDALLTNSPQPLKINPGRHIELHRIGDAVTSRDIHSAILDALRLCAAI